MPISLSVCKYVFMFLCTYVMLYVIRTYARICVYIYVFIYGRMFVCLYVGMDVLYVCIIPEHRRIQSISHLSEEVQPGMT